MRPVETADTTGPVSGLVAMKRGQVMQHAFGIGNALVGDWPVVRIHDGRARIAEFGSVPDWLERNGDLLGRHLGQLGQLWHQRIARGPRRRVNLPGAEDSDLRSETAS